MKTGRLEKRYSLKDIASKLKIDRKELYNISQNDFYKSEGMIISVILRTENKKELLKIFSNLQRDSVDINLKEYNKESQEVIEALKFILKTKLSSKELIEYFYLKDKKEILIKREIEKFNKEIIERGDIFDPEMFK